MQQVLVAGTGATGHPGANLALDGCELVHRCAAKVSTVAGGEPEIFDARILPIVGRVSCSS